MPFEYYNILFYTNNKILKYLTQIKLHELKILLYNSVTVGHL